MKKLTALTCLVVVAALTLFTCAQASADRAPLPREKRFETPDGFGDIVAFCDGLIRVYVAEDDAHASSVVAAVKDSEAC